MAAMAWVFLAASASGGDGGKVPVPVPVPSSAPAVKVVTRVVGGRDAANRDDAARGDRKATVEELQRAGIDVDGLEKIVSGLLDRVVADAKQGKVPDEAALKGTLPSSGAPVDGVRVHVVEGDAAIEDFVKRFPEIKSQVDALLQQAHDFQCGQASDAKTSHHASKDDSKSTPSHAASTRKGAPRAKLPPLRSAPTARSPFAPPGPRLPPPGLRPKFAAPEAGAAR